MSIGIWHFDILMPKAFYSLTPYYIWNHKRRIQNMMDEMEKKPDAKKAKPAVEKEMEHAKADTEKAKAPHKK